MWKASLSTRSDRPRSGCLRGWNLDLGGVYVLALGRRATRRGSRPSGAPSVPDGHFLVRAIALALSPMARGASPTSESMGTRDACGRRRTDARGTARNSLIFKITKLERVKGIEPSYSAWKAAALPLSYTRIPTGLTRRPQGRKRWRATGRAGPLLLPGTGETGPALLRAHRDDGWWRGLDLNQRRQSQRIYSPSPLTTRAPLHNDARHRGPSCRSRKASSRTGDAGKPQRPKVTQSLNSNRHPRPGLCENTVPKSTGNRRLPRQRPRPCGRLGRTHRINPSRNARPHRDAPCAGRPRLTKPRHV